MSKRVIIIGGGASGLAAAITAAEAGASVTLLEHNDKPGRKLLATGNGRCNFTNTEIRASDYIGDDPEKIQSVLDRFPPAEVMNWFEKLGILPKTRDTLVYPNSDQAAAVLSVLLWKAQSLKVKLKTREEVTGIRKENDIFKVLTPTYAYEGDAVIVASGSPASNIQGCTGFAVDLARELAIPYEPFRPVMGPVAGIGNWFSKWAGVRVDANCRLLAMSELIAEERGELQLTDQGASGIPIFQLTLPLDRCLKESVPCLFEFDFLPDFTLEEVTALLEKRMADCPYKSMAQCLTGLIPEKLISLIVKDGEKLQDTVRFLKRFPMLIKQIQPFSQVQLGAGGISLSACTEELECRMIPGLFFAGEALNCAGRCGGYNLQWAWASGHTVGLAAAGWEHT